MKVLKSLGCIAAILFCSAPAFPQTGIEYTIHWSPVTGADVSQVLIYRSSVDKDNNFVPTGSAASSETTYTDMDASLDYDVTYWYRLKSQGATGTLGSFSTNVVSALSISDEASESLKSQCRIDSVVTVDSVTCRVYWTTAVASTGRLWYRRVGESTVVETETVSNSATRHDLLLEGLAESATYLVRAVTRDASGMALTISSSQSFTTSSSSANFEIVASADSVVVPEGGTATLGVKLSAQPSDAVELTIERSSGDADISIQSGAVLEFSTSDWAAYKTVTFAAAADPDVENGSASVIVYVSSGASAPSMTVRVVESDDDDLAFVLDCDTVVVAEGGTSEFHVRLTGEPSEDVHVLVSRSSGDADITVQSGGSLVFTAEDWDVDQTVVLAAADDQDSQDGEATIRIRALSGSAVPDAALPAREDDDDPPPIEPDQSVSGAIVAYPMPYRPDLGSLTVAKVPIDGSLDIYDLAGRKIWSTSWSGRTEVAWSGVNGRSCTVASGRYFMVVKNGAGCVVDKRTILIVR